jgi:hypothetical protein
MKRWHGHAARRRVDFFAENDPVTRRAAHVNRRLEWRGHEIVFGDIAKSGGGFGPPTSIVV